jgi:hypothetical protein
MPYVAPLLVTSLLAGLFLGLVLAMRQMRRRREARRDLLMGHKCKCGYLLAGLELPRCPECGRMVGFDKTPEQLGLSVPELEAHVAQKQARLKKSKDQ